MKRLLILCVTIVGILTIVAASQKRSTASVVSKGTCWSSYRNDPDYKVLRCIYCDYVNGIKEGIGDGECSSAN